MAEYVIDRERLRKLREHVKEQIGHVPAHGHTKLLGNYYPDDAAEQVDVIFKIVLEALRYGRAV
jgi:hypothetical protein